MGVPVEHVDGRELARPAARPAGAADLLDDVRVRVLLQVDVWTVSRTVVGVVRAGRDDPVPAEVVEVDHQREPTAVRLSAVVRAEVAARRALGPPSVRADVNLQHWQLPAPVRSGQVRSEALHHDKPGNREM